MNVNTFKKGKKEVMGMKVDKITKEKEVTCMRSILLAVCLVFIALTFIAVHADAVTGECSGCHTMHNSQGGATVDPDDVANAQLLNAGCVGCHTGPHDTLGKNALGAPVVLDSVDPSPLSQQGGGFTNAGGDFWWVENETDAKGHNVFDISANVDVPIGNTPPGWDPDATNGHTFGQVAGGVGAWGSQLTCAGTFGCHGVRTTANSLQAIAGSHHNNTPGAGGVVSATQASTADAIENSYRFLAEIKGLEQAEWNWNETPALHNEYYGIDFQNAERDDDGLTPAQVYPPGQDTMSYFCAQCHGNFHSEIDDDTTHGSPWRRHPTDIVLPGGATEYAQYNNDGGAAGDYNVAVPVARPVVPANSTNTVAPADSASADGAIVMCLSCHRAHGSPEDDMLRWTYSTMLVGSGPGTNNTGCFVCHNDKN
jgi:predicted CXXCH cytochrome family protein